MKSIYIVYHYNYRRLKFGEFLFNLLALGLDTTLAFASQSLERFRRIADTPNPLSDKWQPLQWGNFLRIPFKFVGYGVERAGFKA